MYTALVVGSTGAVGRELVAELVKSTKCQKIIALSRRDIPVEEWKISFPTLDIDQAKQKLEIRKIDFETLNEKDINEKDGIDAAFCTLGTTRADAGSAQAFRKVDLEYSTRFANLSKAANVAYFGLLTSQGANKNSWFLYPQTKGELEEVVKSIHFTRTSIFRPGLLQRGNVTRTIEKWAGMLLPSVTVATVAKAMVLDYEQGTDKVKEWSDGEIKRCF